MLKEKINQHVILNLFQDLHTTASNRSRNKFGMTGEGGRSMIEMLGVLAIIGVLSVGGIAGYTTAMRSYKANEIINGASMVYMLGLSSNGGEGNGTGITYTSSIGGSLSALKEITYNNGAITVEITEDAVCNQVKTKLGGKVTGGDCASKTNGAYSLAVNFGGESSEEERRAACEDDCGDCFYVSSSDICCNINNGDHINIEACRNYWESIQ